VLIPDTGRDTASMGLAGCADVTEDGVIAGAEVESEGDGKGVSKGARLRLTSHAGRNGEIATAESEVTGGSAKDVTALSSDLCAPGSPAVADGPGAILNGFRLALARTTSRWTTQTTNTIAARAIPVKKAESSRVIRTFNSRAAA
jgi:hypothetical protein